MPTDVQLSAANIPRRYWTVGAKESSREQVAAIITDLEDHFVAGDNYMLAGKDFSTRTAVASWLGIKAMETGNRYFRDKWSDHKPVEPNAKEIPFTVRFTEVQPLVDMRMQRQDDDLLNDWAYKPDIVILSELGAGRQSSIYYDAVDDLLRYRTNEALMTIITMTHDVRESPSCHDATRSILSSSMFKEIRL